MTGEEHLFLSKYIFESSVALKKSIRIPLQTHECVEYKNLDPKWREYYETLSYKIGTDFKLKPETYLPF